MNVSRETEKMEVSFQNQELVKYGSILSFPERQLIEKAIPKEDGFFYETSFFTFAHAEDC
ncbi:hypothetical protein LROSL3_0123 [Furfurilactobacillus rossiae]|nr:hypothetical protein LROSL2_0122 [Furfurilactobacillus rossiae]QLE67905.1 hypothetical protein LROSL3_0123 [Furfurilactobacillus rossiae]